MKLRTGFVCSLILIVGQLFAQKGLHIGANGSLTSHFIVNQSNYGTLDGFNNAPARGSELNYELTFGHSIGATIGYNFNHKLGIQVELLLDKAGQKYKDEIAQEAPLRYIEVKRDVDLYYLEMPFLVQYQPSKKRAGYGSKVRYYIAAGPQLGFLLSAKEKVEINEEGIENNTTGVAANDKFSALDIGLAINNGLNFYLTRSLYLNTGLHMYVGIKDINGKTIKDLGYYSDNDIKYQASRNFRAGLNVGLHFLLSGKGY